MSRPYMATVLIALSQLATQREILLKLVYSVGAYKPPSDQAGTYIDFKPVEGFEGWTLFPERPLSVILGLGYEKDQAVGAVEHFDPSGTWAFIPIGDNPQFLVDVNASNESLKDILEKDRIVNYSVAQPTLLYSELRGLADVLSKRSRVIMVPAGPKIFSAISMLVCLELGDELSLWRASSHASTEPTDTLPAGRIITFDYKFKSTQLEVIF